MRYNTFFFFFLLPFIHKFLHVICIMHIICIVYIKDQQLIFLATLKIHEVLGSNSVIIFNEFFNVHSINKGKEKSKKKLKKSIENTYSIQYKEYIFCLWRLRLRAMSSIVFSNNVWCGITMREPDFEKFLTISFTYPHTRSIMFSPAGLRNIWRIRKFCCYVFYQRQTFRHLCRMNNTIRPLQQLDKTTFVFGETAIVYPYRCSVQTIIHVRQSTKKKLIWPDTRREYIFQISI